MDLHDMAAERGILAGICRYGKDGYMEVKDLLLSEVFEHINRCIFDSLENAFAHNIEVKVDIPSIFSSAKELGLNETLQEEVKYVQALFNFNVEFSNLRTFASKIRKLYEIRELRSKLSETDTKLSQLTGQESMSEISSVAEGPIFSFLNQLVGNDIQIKQIGTGIEQYLDHLKNNPDSFDKISTGFLLWEKLIGKLVNGVHVIGARKKTGKAQPLYSLVWTPNGHKCIGDLMIGDKVCDENGTFNEVVAIPFEDTCKVYKVKFRDGDYFECSEDHLLKVRNCFHPENGYVIMSVKDILSKRLKISSGYKWFVELPKPVLFGKKKEFLISPYLMGILLGDGCFRSNSLAFTSNDQQIVDHINNEVFLNKYSVHKINKKIGYIITQGRTGKKNIYIQEIKKYRLWNLKSNNKFIPKEYLFGDIDCRINLLQGLLDSDGYVNKRGGLGYSTTSIKMANQVKFLVNSLGGICKIKLRRTRYTKKDGSKSKYFKSYRLRISISNDILLFKLERKVQAYKKRTKKILNRVIDSIEYVGEKKCRCITVSSNSGLYLTNNFIVTHNSFLGMNAAIFSAAFNKIKTLLVDTEMRLENGGWLRLLTRLSDGVMYDEIKYGSYLEDADKVRKVQKAARILQRIPLYYVNITGKSFEEMISIIRRWLVKDVGYTASGELNNCFVVFDYLKLNDYSLLKSMQEYQILGSQMNLLHDLTQKYNFPILTFVQLSREMQISASDRISWACTSYSSMHRKTEEEIQSDVGGGNIKLIIEDARHGEGLEPGDYINYYFQGKLASIKEGKTRNQRQKEKDATASMQANTGDTDGTSSTNDGDGTDSNQTTQD